MDKLYLAAVTIFGIGWYIEQRMYVDGYTRRKRDPYKPIDYLGVCLYFSSGYFSYIIKLLLPFKYPVKLDTEYFGGISTSM